jgi:signal transduction histidine kinase
MWRVALLCAVLLACLLAAVYVITRYYFREVAQEMEQQALEMVRSVQYQLSLGADPEEIAQPSDRRAELEVRELTSDDAGLGELRTSSHLIQGRVIHEAQREFFHDGRRYLLVLKVEVSTQREILRAFSRPYMAAVTGVFILALGLMVYFIIRILRPITELSETCTAISRGELKNVNIDDSSGEIRSLAHTFNTMVGALREKELMEANLRQAQRLSSLGNLAAGVAHDIRNPLNAIKLLSSHTLDTLAGMPGAEGSAKHLQTIREEVDRLEEIVSRFLSLAKEREIQPEPVAVDRLLEACVALLRKDAEERKVRLTADLRAGDTVLLLDPELWRRAVLNVLINALEACPAGGRVRLFSRITSDDCEIEVRDDGPGMSREVAERAFEPYFTTKGTGTGLGLSITRGIVEEHGGRITLTCTEGQGCHVLIAVPLEGKKV